MRNFIYEIRTLYEGLVPINSNHSAFRNAKKYKTGIDVYYQDKLYLRLPYELLDSYSQKSKPIADKFRKGVKYILFYYDKEVLKAKKQQATLFNTPELVK